MLEISQAELKSAAEIVRAVRLESAPNGLRYGSYGSTGVEDADLKQIVAAVPRAMAAALEHRAYYFVPLVLHASERESEPVLIAPESTEELADRAVCHRNATLARVEAMFVSTRLMQDRFALAFEFYINAGHHFVDAAGVPAGFADLIWTQVQAGVRGETSQDAWDTRARALSPSQPESSPAHSWAKSGSGTANGRKRKLRLVEPRPQPVAAHAVDEKARIEYSEAAFADALAIYLLSLTVDFDYAELREREYALLAAPALAERLRHVAALFPPNPGDEFSIRYRGQAAFRDQ